MSETKTVELTDKTIRDMPPTRACLICGKPENPERRLVIGYGWLCPECKGRLKKLLYDDVTFDVVVRLPKEM